MGENIFSMNGLQQGTGLSSMGLGNETMNLYKELFPDLGNQGNISVPMYDKVGLEQNLQKALTDSIKGNLEWNNSWMGGKGLSALQGLGNLYGLYTGYQAYKDNKKTSALQREIMKYNLQQTKDEYGRLKNQRKTLTDSFHGRSV